MNLQLKNLIRVSSVHSSDDHEEKHGGLRLKYDNDHDNKKNKRNRKSSL